MCVRVCVCVWGGGGGARILHSTTVQFFKILLDKVSHLTLSSLSAGIEYVYS